MQNSEAFTDPFHEHRPLIAESHGAHAHGHHHDHGHSHAGGHHHLHHAGQLHRPAQRRAFLICILLTVAMMIVETVGGYLFRSLMLHSDAIHMFSHAAALGVSYAAILLASRRTSENYSFGLFRIEILGAFINGVLLVFFTVWIVYEAIHHIAHPEHIRVKEMFIVAVLGLFVNLGTAVILYRSGVEDLNTKSAFLHMLGDTLSSIGIVVGAGIVWLTGWTIIDPLLSILIALVIGRWAHSLLRDSIRILMERKPDGIDLDEVKESMRARSPEEVKVEDLHVWEITSQYVCLSARLEVKGMSVQEASQLRIALAEELRDRFGIAHATLWFVES